MIFISLIGKNFRVKYSGYSIFVDVDLLVVFELLLVLMLNIWGLVVMNNFVIIR